MFKNDSSSILDTKSSTVLPYIAYSMQAVLYWGMGRIAFSDQDRKDTFSAYSHDVARPYSCSWAI